MQLRFQYAILLPQEPDDVAVLLFELTASDKRRRRRVDVFELRVTIRVRRAFATLLQRRGGDSPVRPRASRPSSRSPTTLARSARLPLRGPVFPPRNLYWQG